MIELKHATTTLPVLDLDRARRFYHDTLGLTEAGQSAGNPVLRVGDGSTVELHRIPEPTLHEHTAMSFEVDDLDRAIRDLETRGVTFEDYDLPDLKTENHVAWVGQARAAWFRDPEGNILCLHEAPKGSGAVAH